jgi:hypothetical protein
MLASSPCQAAKLSFNRFTARNPYLQRSMKFHQITLSYSLNVIWPVHGDATSFVLKS